MKNLIYIFLITLSTISYSQTAITDSNREMAITDCLFTNPVDGMCSDSEYGLMPNWDVSNVTNMSAMFEYAPSFNGDISNWDVSNVTNMSNMFASAPSFNGDISNWDVSSVTNMSLMFANASSFNQPLNDWETSSVTNMYAMFAYASSFNADVSNWDVSSTTNMNTMFTNASSFNQPLNDWETSSVTNMYAMFANATSFNGDVSNWDVSSVTELSAMFGNSALSTENYDALLNGWSQQNVQSNVTFGAQFLNYCNGVDARQSLIDNHNWTINDAGLDCSTAGVDDQNQLVVSVYPNPTSDIVYIEGNYTQLKVVVYNILGKEVVNKSITNSIDISHLENGVYLMKLSDGSKLTTQRIIKN